MMKKNLLFFSLLCFIHIICGEVVKAASPALIDVPLDAPEGFSAVAIDFVGNGQYCVIGSVYDDANQGELAIVFLVDTAKRQVLWRTSIPYAHDYVGNGATNCIGDGGAYYVLTQDYTNSSEAFNQTRITINKLSIEGKLLGQRPIEAGFDEWSYLLTARKNVISVVGGTSATLNRGGEFATFIAQFNSDLVQAKTVKLDNGAFWVGSNAKLDGRHLLVSGQFLANVNSSSGHAGLALSKIDIGTNKYLWSTYAAPANTRQAISFFSSENTTYTVALTQTNLAVVSIDSAGKIVHTFSTKKPLCSIAALTLDGPVLKAIGSACGGQSFSVITMIDLDARTTTTHQLGSEISAPLFDVQSWVGIVNTKAHGEVFRRSAL